MEMQQTQQSGTSTGYLKKGLVGKRLRIAGLVFGTQAIVIATIWLIFYADPSSRPSTALEIEAQKEFQVKLNTALDEYRQKVDATTKEAELKSELIGK